jgi:hypothetical protein
MVAFSPSARSDVLWGVNGHPLVSYPGVTIERQLGLLQDLGLKSYRVDISGLDQMARLAQLVAAAKSRGIQILPVVAPALSLDKDTPEQLYAKAHALASTLVARFKDDIRVWELGNEMENYAIIRACEMREDGTQYNCGWGPAGGVSPLDYYGPRWAKVSAVLKGLSDGTSAVDPTIRKAMGTAGWGHLGAFTRMQQDGIRWDISVWHMYGQDPEWAFKFLAKFERPIWVTEFNHGSGGHRSALEQADGLTRAMVRMRQLREAYNVEAAHIYELMDESYWAPNFEAFMGLVTLERNEANQWKLGSPKPAYAAVKAMVSAPQSAEVRRACNLNPSNKLSTPYAIEVSYIYCLTLQRAVDEHGLSDWAAALSKGMVPTQLAEATIASAEFQQKHGDSVASNARFVSLLWRLLLGREPEEVESGESVARLESKAVNKAELAKALMNSEEFKARHPLLFPLADPLLPRSIAEIKTPKQSVDCDLRSLAAGAAKPSSRVAYAFCLVLDRTPGDDELKEWTAYLEKGRRNAQMVIAMLSSPEFRDRHKAWSLRPSEFVNAYRRRLLGHDPDTSAAVDLVARLEAGHLSRAGAVEQIVSSAEFAAANPLLANATVQDAK